MAVGVEDIQIMLAIFIPLITILVIPLVVYFHRNGMAFERLKLQTENLCHCAERYDKDREEIETLKRENERIAGHCKSLERRLTLLESNTSHYYKTRHDEND